MKAEWKIRLGTIFWFVLVLGFLLSLPIILDWAAWAILLVFAIAAGLAVPVAWIGRAIFARGHRSPFAASWLRSGAALFFLLSIVVAAPIYYLATITETRPVVFPQATFTNGEKTVVFQGMQHFASDYFYKSVIYDIERALADGYVIYYEGVQTATPESREFFARLSSALTGSADLEGFYRAMGETCGMKFQQDYFTLLDADKKEHPERHVIADVDALELKTEYERLLREDPEFAKAHAGDFEESPAAASEEVLTALLGWLESGSEGRKKLAGVVCRGFMTLALGEKEEKSPGPFEPVILDFRNRALADRITGEAHDRIFITYGARHLDGVFELLKQHDPEWKITTVKWMRTIEMPKKNYPGRLAAEIDH